MCFLIQFEYVALAVGSVEWKSFCYDLFPSVPKRTQRYFTTGSLPRRKTTDAMVSDILKLAPDLGEEMARSALQSMGSWKDVIGGYKAGWGDSFPKSFGYAEEVILQIENAQLDAFSAKAKGDARWVDQFRKSGLPSEVMPEHYLENLARFVTPKMTNSKETVIPFESMRVALVTWLYVIAALEVSLIHSGLVPSNVGAWVHRRMPHYRDKELIGPMRKLFEDLMGRLGINSLTEFAERLPSLTLPQKDKDRQNQRRQIARWMSGEALPSWEYIRVVRDKFPGVDDGIFVMYGVARFLQVLLKDCQSYIPTAFSDEAELVDIFQEYPILQECHSKGFAEWSEARG